MFTSGSLTTFNFDSEYMRRLAEGDPSVEEHFTTYFGRLLFLKLRGRVRSAQLAEDIKQETFLRVLRQIRSQRGIDQPERLGGFVNRVCHIVMMEFFRSESRHPLLQESAPDPPDQTIDLEGALVDDERKRMVRSVLAELSAKDRTILRMVFLEDTDKDKVCTAMRVNRGYLRVLLHRARQRLKKIILERDFPKQMRAGG
jgi:RNA polymerase sigma-70 factor (ECF subfamily)